MNRIYSNYKVLGGFGLTICLNALIGIVNYTLIFDSKINYQVVDLINDPDAMVAYLVLFGIQGLFLVLFITQNKFIISDKDQIAYINPLLPFLRTTNSWDIYDYWVIVNESSSAGTYEAIWLIKNNRIKNRFSSFYYTNYSKLKRNVEGSVKGKGQLKIGSLGQLTALLGFKIK